MLTILDLVVLELSSSHGIILDHVGDAFWYPGQSHPHIALVIPFGIEATVIHI